MRSKDAKFLAQILLGLESEQWNHEKFHSLKSFKTQIAPNSMKSQSDFDVTCTNLKHLYVKQLESCFVRISCKPWIAVGFQLGGANRK